MINDKYRAESSFGEGKEPPGVNPPEVKGGQGPAGAQQKSGHADERDEFSSTLEESAQKAEEAGRSAARRFREGLFLGAGKKVAEFVWDKAKELINQGDS